ncbi:MAG: DUF1501 domain-containing protein [Anaerolineae bacterium]|nr:DUF1501 domain-containing protein [Gloeobacterales cyanobacterium ES-bin-313]
MDRREFLAFSAILALGSNAWAGQVQAASTTTNRKRLIVIFLRGAVDGLNIVVPYGESAYYQSRPRIAVPRPDQANGALDLDGHFGLNPGLAAILPLWKQGSLAFVHGAGSPDVTRSHFDAQDFMESGTPGIKSTPDGWMNRLLGNLGGANPVQAINVGATMPRILSGPRSVASLATGRGSVNFSALDRPQVASAFDSLYGGNDALSKTYQEGRSARKTIMDDLKSPDAEMKAANNGALSVNGFAGDAQRLAKLMVRDTNVQLGFIAVGGWDTHVNEAGQLNNRLRQLGQGIATLAQTLGPIYNDTAIVVLSEFGRTVRENGNGGTDHGHGNVIWLAGGSVKGGKVYGQWPGLSSGQLYEGRDLMVTTDFRDVISTVLDQHLQLDNARIRKVLPGFTATQGLPLISTVSPLN